MEIVARIIQSKGNVLRTQATDSAQQDTLYLVKNPFSSFLSESTMSLNGEKIELRPTLHIKISLRLNFHPVVMQNKQEYYEDNPSGIDGAKGRADDVAERKQIIFASMEVRLFGKTACDFLSCDKHLISCVTLRFSLRRSLNDVVVMSEHQE